MNTEMQQEEAGAAATNESPERGEPGRWPWLTCLAVLGCVGLFLGLTAQNDYGHWDTLAKFGYLPADAVWQGGYWALITSVFVHLDFLHVAVNVYWLWVLGGRMERVIGSLPFLAFFMVAALVSSSLQLAVSGDTGHGASGVVYAVFGFMWVSRREFPPFEEALDSKTIKFFVAWLVGCFVATHLGIWQVGNAAHLSGLVFGALAAGAIYLSRQRIPMLAGLAVVVAASVATLFWNPWSVTWLSHKAYDAHAAQQYHAALDRYSQILEIDPNNAWAFLNRSYVLETLGRPDQAERDLSRAREIDPSIEHAP